jgi:hypothetical protein
LFAICAATQPPTLRLLSGCCCRQLAGAWAAAAAPPAGMPCAAAQPQLAALHGDRVVLSGGYWDGSLRWVC